MSRPRTKKNPAASRSDPIFDSSKKAAWVCLLFPLLAAGVAYAAYTDDLGVSDWPWKVSIAVLFASLVALGIIFMRARGSNRVWALGLTQCIGIFAVYFFFGVFAYFFLFLFAPLSPQVRWSGLIGGISITAYWLYTARKNVLHTIQHTEFVGKAFNEQTLEFRFNVQSGMREFERLNKEKSPFPKFLALVVAGIAPFYLILQRVLSGGFGTDGVLFFLAIFGMPVSLWFAGLLVRIYLVMVALPARLYREHGKPAIIER